eukprot:scaffold733_cov267-Pinguiococcus_pyrenoidosus.AAC.53
MRRGSPARPLVERNLGGRRMVVERLRDARRPKTLESARGRVFRLRDLVKQALCCGFSLAQLVKRMNVLEDLVQATTLQRPRLVRGLLVQSTPVRGEDRIGEHVQEATQTFNGTPPLARARLAALQDARSEGHHRLTEPFQGAVRVRFALRRLIRSL